MKRWEVAKHISEGRWQAGQRFRVEFPDGDIGEAVVDEYNILRWDVEGASGWVQLSSQNGERWTAIKYEEEEKWVKLPQSRLDYLEEREEFLNCLEACGVDNWEGYGDAYQMLEEDE